MHRNSSRASDSKRDKGSALLICLGVLAILSLLATALVFMSKESLVTAFQYVDKTRAKMTAESGVETAIAKLISFEGDSQQLKAQIETTPTLSTIPSVPVKDLQESSFGTIDSTGNGFNDIAGLVSQTYHQHGESFKLRVESVQHKLNINDTNTPINYDDDPYHDQLLPEQDYNMWPVHLQDPSGKDPDWIYPGDPAYDPTLVSGNLPYINPAPDKAPGRLFTIVKELLYIKFGDNGTETTWTKDYSWAEKVGTELFNARRRTPSDLFISMEEVKQAMVQPGLLSQKQFQIFRSFITLSSWTDKNVLRPTFTWNISRPDTDVEHWPKDYDLDILGGIVKPEPDGLPDRPNFHELHNGNLNS